MLLNAIAIILRLLPIKLTQLNAYRFLAIFLATVTFLVISSCYQNAAQPDQTAAKSAESCQAVEHFMGETCVPQNPKRIISLYTTPLANLLALGIEPIAITPATGTIDEFPPYLAEKVEGMEIVGIDYGPNLEKITHLEPDLIIGWGHHEKTYPLLSQIGPTLLAPQEIIESANADWKKYTNYLATALEKQERGQQIFAEYDRRIADLKSALGDFYSSKTISVAHVSNEYGNEAYVANSFPGSILSDLELQRPQPQTISRPGGTIEAISEENLDLIDGDLLFILIYADDDRQRLDNLLTEPLWKRLKAVQNGRVYLVDGWTWGVANPLAANVVIDDLYKHLVDTP